MTGAVAIKDKAFVEFSQSAMRRASYGLISDGTGSVAPADKIVTHPGSPKDPSIAESHESLLMAKIASGERAAFESIVDAHLPRLLAVSRRMLGDEGEAEDVVQEAFLRLWQNADKFDPSRAKLSTWLHRITSNLCIDRLRGRKDLDWEEVGELAEPSSQDREVVEKQLSQRMQRVLLALPERQRLALILFHYQELRVKEVASIMDVSPDAVESLIRRARQTLKKKLERDWKNFLPEEAG